MNKRLTPDRLKQLRQHHLSLSRQRVWVAELFSHIDVIEEENARLQVLYEGASEEIGSCVRNAPVNPKFDVRSCSTCGATKTCAALIALDGEAQ